MEKRVVVGGSRTFQDYSFLKHTLDHCLARIMKEYQVIILSGHCRGTDALAERYAKERGLSLEIYPADWSLGRKAGPLRNQQMVDLADYVVAFPGGGPRLWRFFPRFLIAEKSGPAERPRRGAGLCLRN